MQLPQAAAVGGPWMVDNGEHWPVLLVGGPRMVDNGVIFNPWQCWLTNRQQEGLNKVDDGCQKEAETLFLFILTLHVVFFSSALRITQASLFIIITLSSIFSLVFSSGCHKSLWMANIVSMQLKTAHRMI